MKIENIVFWALVLVFIVVSCGKEPQPSFLSGKYDAFTYEVLDCDDPSINVRVDLTKDSMYLFNCDTFIINCDTMIVPDTFYVDTTLTTIDTIIIDTIVMGCEEDLRNCNIAEYNEVQFEIDSINGNYTLIVDRDYDGLNDRMVTNGTYISTGFNDLNFCVNDCVDSLWYTGVYVRVGTELTLSWSDTIDTGCSFFLQGNRIQ